jgi:cytidine deaminase
VELVAAARAARAAAYAPYSAYPVGAAVLAEDGRVFCGCNVENALFSATLCAERVAVVTAVAAGARRLRAIAVVTPNGGPPCGFCRQVLAEFAGPELPIAVAAPDGPWRRTTLGQLLPNAWGRGDLGGPAEGVATEEQPGNS